MFLTKRILSSTVLLVVLFGSWDGFGQTGTLKKDPSKLLQKYLSLDIKGARLEALSQESQKPYVDWTEEPVWGQVVVVTGYEIADKVEQWEVKDNLDVVIPVEFKVLGSVYLDTATFFSDSQIERVGFHIKAVRGYWRIVEPLLPPHVGQKRMLNFIRQAMVEETEPSRQAALAALRDELKKAQ